MVDCEFVHTNNHRGIRICCCRHFFFLSFSFVVGIFLCRFSFYPSKLDVLYEYFSAFTNFDCLCVWWTSMCVWMEGKLWKENFSIFLSKHLSMDFEFTDNKTMMTSMFLFDWHTFWVKFFFVFLFLQFLFFVLYVDAVNNSSVAATIVRIGCCIRIEESTEDTHKEKTFFP